MQGESIILNSVFPGEYKYSRFEVFVMVKINIAVLLIMTPCCNLVGGYKCLEEHTASIYRAESGSRMLLQKH
jgi:hypothetical protein